jgi:pyruvate/2-oxoglutarate dehydrogenase complex dihydrolipoamide acyltransferase (E2) component
MILRKVRLGALIVSLALLLTACVEVKGDLSINSAARLNGELTYTLDKSFASAAGIGSLADINSEASSSEDPIDFCKDVPFIEDSTKYILKCALKDAISESGDITASVVGSNIVFRYKANLDATSDQTNFGSVSLTVRFIDPIVSIKENKVGLVKKVDNLTYRISGYATEPMDIEITANCSSRCGMINQVPAPVPSKTTSSTDAASAAVDAANKATDEANKAAADASAAIEAKQKAIDDANAATDAALKAAEAADAKIAAEQAAKEKAAAEKAAEAKAAAAKAAADKLAADVKAAAAKAAAELKAAAEKAAADLKAKQEAEAKALAEKAAADKAAAEKLLSDAKVAAAKILADAKAKATAVAKKITITCVKGKLIKNVIAVKPVCPPGYKKK